jgi:adenylyltransferase/sulfurtransferase
MDRLHELNPHVELVPHEVRLTRDNALALLGEYDVIVDGTDNFPTRYLVNDACVLLGKPNVHGAIYRFDGQASVFAVKGRACYRCLHPVPPRPEDAPSCAEAGVLGVLPGLIGAIQATETLKLLLGGGDTLVDRLLVVDAWRMRFRELRLRRDPACPVCGDAPTVRALVDYEAFCAGPAATPSASPEISARELASRLALGHDLLLLDVREPHEHALARLPGSVLVPLGALASRVAELAPTREVVLFCKEGGRSARGLRLLREAGFGGKMLSLKGGLSAWRAEVDPELPRY